MTPADIRSRKLKLISELPDMPELLKHPLVRDTKDGAFIVMMTANTVLEILARDMEEEQLSSNAEGNHGERG